MPGVEIFLEGRGDDDLERANGAIVHFGFTRSAGGGGAAAEIE